MKMLLVARLVTTPKAKVEFQSSSFFLNYLGQSVIKEFKQKAAELEQGIHSIDKVNGHFAYLVKTSNRWAAFVVDEPLKEQQCFRLANAAFEPEQSLKEILNSPENFAQDQKIKRLQDDLEELKAIMLRNIEAVISRGEKIDQLVQKTEELEATSFRFKRSAEDLNSCFPWCNIM